MTNTFNKKKIRYVSIMGYTPGGPPWGPKSAKKLGFSTHMIDIKCFEIVLDTFHSYTSSCSLKGAPTIGGQYEPYSMNPKSSYRPKYGFFE